MSKIKDFINFKRTSGEKAKLKEKILFTLGSVFNITAIPLLMSGNPIMQCIGGILMTSGGGIVTYGLLSKFDETNITQTEWRKDLDILSSRIKKYSNELSSNNDLSNN